MKKKILFTVISTLIASSSIAAETANIEPMNCSATGLPSLKDVEYTEVKKGETHCSVNGYIEGDIGFSVSLPHEWNGRFAQSGGAGFVGEVFDFAPVTIPNQGYATAGTDTGHKGNPMDPSFATQIPDRERRIENFSGRALHLTTVVSKQVVEHYYQQEIERNIFFGCSRGGGQALYAAQNHPTDYDVIVAGAPAYDWTHQLGGGQLAINQKVFPNSSNMAMSGSILDEKSYTVVHNAVSEQCTNRDGLDNAYLTEPWKCDIDFSALQCADGSDENCLTEAQVDAFEIIYGGAYDSYGKQLTTGFYVGASQSQFDMWIAGGVDHPINSGAFHEGAETEFPTPYGPNNGYRFGALILEHLVFNGDESFDYAAYDLDNLDRDTMKLAKQLNAPNPDLSEFRNNGGKLLIYTGLHDLAISPSSTINYYNNVIANDPSAAQDVALYTLPGVNHCSGGEGPSFVDWVGAANDMKDSNKITELTAHWLVPGKGLDGSRKICPFPQIAQWDGEGDKRSHKSFSCIDPK